MHPLGSFRKDLECDIGAHGKDREVLIDNFITNPLTKQIRHVVNKNLLARDLP
jgi:hypothetical protein